MRTLILCTFLGALFFVPRAHAQAPAPAVAPATPGPNVEALKKRLAAQQKQLDAQRKQLEALVKAQAERDKRTKKVVKQVKRIKDEREAEQLKKLGEVTQKRFKPSFRLFGFTDFNFMMRRAAGHNKFGRLIMTEEASFYMLSANLYASSRITRNLSVLAELRFSYLPHGDLRGVEAYFKTGDQLTLVDGTKYLRNNTLTYSPLDGSRARQGGLFIERLHIDYRVADWLQFRVGRFLTPYGIWNIDHGSPVVIPASVPWFQRTNMVPGAQTGIQVWGKHFFTDRLRLDYAVTLSNGRGPMDEVSDVDDMFAYGARLRLHYETAKVKFALGGYGYYGRLKEKAKHVIIDPTVDYITVGDSVINHKDEFIFTLDLLIQAFGARLQAEYVYGYNKYLGPSVGEAGTFSMTAPGGDTAALATTFGHGVYVLLAYTLPLKKWLGDLKFTPFVAYEYSKQYDWKTPTTLVTAGLNFRPLPALVFKAQWEGIWSEHHGNFNSAMLQMAVAF